MVAVGVADEQSIFPWEVSPGVQLHIPHRYIEMEITTFNEEVRYNVPVCMSFFLFQTQYRFVFDFI